MEAAAVPYLKLVDPATGELVERGHCPNCAEAEKRIAELEKQAANDYARRDAEDLAAGYKATVDAQARRIGTLERKITEEEDPSAHPQGKEIVALIERWKRGSGHDGAKISADRVKLVKARIRDGYPIASEEAEPTLELAVDGICAFPFVVNGQRVAQGNPSQRHDRLGIALAGGEKVEEFARLGYKARKDGLVTWGEAS